MSKEDDPFVLISYVTAEDLVKHYGQTLAALPTAQQQAYVDYALNANRAVTAFLYKWVDKFPIPPTSAAYHFASGIAFKYAQRLKEVDAGKCKCQGL